MVSDKNSRCGGQKDRLCGSITGRRGVLCVVCQSIGDDLGCFMGWIARKPPLCLILGAVSVTIVQSEPDSLKMCNSQEHFGH